MRANEEPSSGSPAPGAKVMTAQCEPGVRLFVFCVYSPADFEGRPKLLLALARAAHGDEALAEDAAGARLGQKRIQSSCVRDGPTRLQDGGIVPAHRERLLGEIYERFAEKPVRIQAA